MAHETQSGVKARLDRFFHISERGSSIPQELRGGLVTFFAMAYIIVLNPLIIGSFGADAGGATDVEGAWLPNGQVAAVTALVGGVMTLAMGLVANLPFGLATGLGINSFVAFGLASQLTWPEAMGLIVIDGIIIVVLALTGLRRAIFDAVPAPMKSAITVGIGLFIAFIGFVDSGFVTATGLSAPPVDLGQGGSIQTLPTIVFLVALVLCGVLLALRVKGALLIGIVATTLLAIVLQAIFRVPVGAADGGWNIAAPELPASIVSVPDLALVGQVDLFGAFARVGPLAATMFVFTLVFMNFFDAMGSMTGLARQAGIAKEDGTFPGLRRGLVVEGFGAILGGVGSTSSNTVYVDSAAGIGDGARTGLASVVTGLLFLVAMFLTPLTAIVPLEVAAAALVIVGALMMSQIKDIDFSDFRVALPAFLTIVVMPFTYNIANGIGIGFIAWVVIHAVTGKARQISPLLWIVAALFLVFFARGPIEALLG